MASIQSTTSLASRWTPGNSDPHRQEDAQFITCSNIDPSKLMTLLCARFGVGAYRTRVLQNSYCINAPGRLSPVRLTHSFVEPLLMSRRVILPIVEEYDHWSTGVNQTYMYRVLYLSQNFVQVQPVKRMNGMRETVQTRVREVWGRRRT